MATDSTELTFVRCHSCRSLVPAVSTRCRMCGATLDAAAAQGDGSGREKTAARTEATKPEGRTPGRIRQRTMSQPDMEFNAAVQQLRTESKDASAVSPAAATLSSEAVNNGKNLHSELEAQGEDPLADYLAGAAKSAVETPKAVATPIEAAPSIESAVKVPVSNGNGKHHAPEHASKEAGAAESRGVVAGGQQSAARPVAAARTESRSIVTRPADRGTTIISGNTAGGGAGAGASTRPLQGMRRAEAVNGRLFGWLVSYTDADGRAIELREGKFFVTANSLKESDLIIDDKSISTPHSLLSVTTGGGFQVQDLMSERGVFVRRANGGAYQKFDDVISLDHGDWVRFGDVEFLVCLVAHVGEQ